MEEQIGRVALALALLGPPLLGVGVPIVSGILLRRLAMRPRVSGAAVAGALALWAGVTIGMATLLIRIGVMNAMAWADSRALAPTSEQVELLAIISAGVLLQLGCGILLHRFLARRSRSWRATSVEAGS